VKSGACSPVEIIGRAYCEQDLHHAVVACELVEQKRVLVEAVLDETVVEDGEQVPAGQQVRRDVDADVARRRGVVHVGRVGRRAEEEHGDDVRAGARALPPTAGRR
jgi:hypothetical protein